MTDTTTPKSPRLLDQVRDALRVRHMSLRTEKPYVHWVRRYILFHGKRHPAEVGEREINVSTGEEGRHAPAGTAAFSRRS